MPTLCYCDGNTAGHATENSITSLAKDKISGTAELQSLNLVGNSLTVRRRKGREDSRLGREGGGTVLETSLN